MFTTAATRCKISTRATRTLGAPTIVTTRTRFVVDGFRGPFFAARHDTGTMRIDSRCGGPGCVCPAGYTS